MLAHATAFSPHFSLAAHIQRLTLYRYDAVTRGVPDEVFLPMLEAALAGPTRRRVTPPASVLTPRPRAPHHGSETRAARAVVWCPACQHWVAVLAGAGYPHQDEPEPYRR